MNIGQRGIDLIKEFEGCKLNAYRDQVGILTCGFGHTGYDVTPATVWSQEEAENVLRLDLARFERCVEDAVTVDITQNQFDALVAFTFNLGCGALAQSTLLKLLNQGSIEAAADQFPHWNKAGGQVVAGLTRRREAEKELFLCG